MTSVRSFLPALNSVLRSLPKHAGFLSVGLPGSAFERTVLALRPDLGHVSALSADLLVALPEFARALVGHGCPRMVLGAQAGEAVIGPVTRLGAGVLRAGACRVTVQAVSGIVAGMRQLALVHIDRSADQAEFLATALAALSRSDALLWVDLPDAAETGIVSRLGQMPGIGAYASFVLSEQGHVRALDGRFDGAQALILVPDRFWHHARFAAPGAGEARCGRLLPKGRDFDPAVSARLAGLPVEDRRPDLPLRYECRFGDGVFADWGAVPTGTIGSEVSAQLRGGQTLRLLVPVPPLDSFFVSLAATSGVTPPEAFTAVVRSCSTVLPMPWDTGCNRYGMRVPVQPSGREPFVTVEIAPANRSGSHIMSLTLTGVEVSAIYCDAGTDPTQPRPY